MDGCSFFMLFGLALFAQSRVITGTVLDAENQPIVGAAVAIKGTTDGTFTDLDGKFSINTSGNAVTLVVSSIGFGTTEVVVSPGQSNVEVRMDFTVLEEVVVTSLGISRVAKTLVYATQSVKPSTLTEVRDANNVINSLQGKIANAVITQASGGPGSGARIVLRGNRSIQGTNNALIVVDGVPITNGTNGTITSDFGGLQGTDGASNINADDIESMTVLRGASAAALYGSQAGNGVIVITTKKEVKIV